MADEHFEILVVKVLTGEAAPDESAQLDALLAKDPDRRNAFIELKSSWDCLRELAPLTQALDAPPSPFPEYRMPELKTHVRRHFSTKPREQPDSPTFFDSVRQWIASHKAISGSVAALLLLLSLLIAPRFGGTSPTSGQGAGTLGYLLAENGQIEVLRSGRTVTLREATPLERGDEIRLSNGVMAYAITPSGLTPIRGPQRLRAEKLDALAATQAANTQRPGESGRNSATLHSALFQPLSQLITVGLISTTRSTLGLALYSPREATCSLTPLVLWKSEPGRTYDVRITDELDPRVPPWQVNAVVPPVDFNQVEAWKGRPLAKEGLYRLYLRETGKPLSSSEYTFRTLGDGNGTLAVTPAEKIAHAHQLLASDSPCPGDALAELMSLPPELADNELVLRLKLALFGQLGLQEDYETTAATLKRMAESRRP